MPSTRALSLSSWSFRATSVALPGMDDDQVVDAERRHQAAVVGDDDRVGRVAGDDVALDGVAGRVVVEKAGDGAPVADVVPVVGDLEHADVGGVFHDGLVDRHALQSGEMPRQGLAPRRECRGLRRIGSRPAASSGRWVRSSSRMVRARQTKIPEFQAKLPAARNRSAVSRSGFSRN